MNRPNLTLPVLLAALALALVLAWGCAGDAPGSPGPLVDPDDPTILRRPFTADQIREEWVKGFSLTMLTVTAAGESAERWTVVAADAEGVDIEYVAVDPGGKPAGESRVSRAGWVELRNHASFPAANSRVEETTRETALGMLDGWLYTVDDPQAGTVTEFFFADELPGAPVELRISRDGVVEMDLRQTERRRPL